MKDKRTQINVFLEESFQGTTFHVYDAGTLFILYWESGPTEKEVREKIKEKFGPVQVSCNRS